MDGVRDRRIVHGYWNERRLRVSTPVFDVALPPELAAITFRSFAPVANLLVVGTATHLYSLDPASGACLPVGAAPSGTTYISVETGGPNVYAILSDNSIVAYAVAGGSGAPIARVVLPVSGPQLTSASMCTMIGYHPEAGIIYVVANYDDYTKLVIYFTGDLRVISQWSQREAGTYITPIRWDGAGTPTIIVWNGYASILFHAFEASIYEPPSVVPPDPRPMLFAAADQPWTYAMADTLNTGYNAVVRGGSGPVRVTFACSDWYGLRTTVDVFEFAGVPPLFPEPGSIDQTTAPDGAAVARRSLVIPYAAPGAMTTLAGGPYLPAGGDAALLFLRHADGTNRAQLWQLPDPEPDTDWPSWWQSEYAASGAAPASYLNIIGDDRYKLWRIACGNMVTLAPRLTIGTRALT
jgi:hypothetical protein